MDDLETLSKGYASAEEIMDQYAQAYKLYVRAEKAAAGIKRRLEGLLEKAVGSNDVAAVRQILLCPSGINISGFGLGLRKALKNASAEVIEACFVDTSRTWCKVFARVAISNDDVALLRRCLDHPSMTADIARSAAYYCRSAMRSSSRKCPRILEGAISDLESRERRQRLRFTWIAACVKN